jgi:tRNA pseudouridine38-40 synthase
VEIFNKLRKIVLVVEYNGVRYFGFQWQKAQPTIQDEIEKAIFKLTGEGRRVIAACRTDTGVHATGQVVSFRTGSALPAKVFVSGLNHYLPRDISVLMAGEVSARFNVMKDAVSREYRYLILNRRSRASLGNDIYYHVAAELDTGRMDLASKLLIGEHDFASFVTDWDREESTVRTIYDAGITREGDLIAFSVKAKSFLTHQVRNMVGTLVRVGMGKMAIEEFKGILEMKKLSLAGPTAPAHGLCLVKVIYADNSEFKYENLCT